MNPAFSNSPDEGSNSCSTAGRILHLAVFLDRDGVINRDTGYVRRVEDFEFIAGVVPALQEIQRRGYLLFVVTNQSGIGRGYYTLEDYQRVNAWMLAHLASNAVTIHGVYVCPHAPDVRCACRKPAPGLLLQAQREHGLDLPNSWLVGDKPSDIEAARRAGVGQTLLIRRSQEIDVLSVKPLFVGDSLRDMIPHLSGVE
ncbi:MAG: D-glycero-beta-D-manno-heptose 1,7-bisphosphate 7-phosphatase [Planctomycetota bacterium]|nr:D-glycero-beta-D-manno-heptose 1,7-bisphosphate 7-phosphatase [Planctomycetota bacterium]